MYDEFSGCRPTERSSTRLTSLQLVDTQDDEAAASCVSVVVLYFSMILGRRNVNTKIFNLRVCVCRCEYNFIYTSRALAKRTQDK